MAYFPFFVDIEGMNILIVGGDELARGTVRLRNMQTKEETEIPLENAVEYMKERI